MDDISLKQSESVVKTVKMVHENSSGSVHIREGTKNVKSASDDPDKKTGPQNLAKLVNQANLKVGTYNNKIKFQLDNDGQPPTILILDKETGKIIRKIPSDEMSDLNSKMEKYVGTIFNGRV